MGRLVPIQLDRERGLLFSVGTTRLATATLQRFLPAGSDKLKMADAAFLVFQHDLDAICIFIQAGLQHEDKDLELRKIESWIDKGLREGRKVADYSRPILEALKAANLIDIVYQPAGVDGAEGGEGDRPTTGREEIRVSSSA